MRNLLIATFLLMGWVINAQTILNIEGRTYTNYDDTWTGVNISRSRLTTFTFKNNSITSVNRYGYMLCAGDELPGNYNNNLAGEVITGNKFTWRGSDMTSITHGLFTGHNINAVIKYNYLDGVPMGIIRKSGNNMSNTAGGIAYNIVKGGAVGVVVKGMSNVKIYNNTLYTDRTTAQTKRPLVHIYTNTDNGGYSVSHGTKIFNNIFYTKHQTYCITIGDRESLTGFECDYNVYWCESGTPVFNVHGTLKTFAQWQAMGYDIHSVVVNPGFIDFVNFIPAKRPDYGKDLGTEWKDGLSVNARWGTVNPATTSQNGTWQVGSVIYAEIASTQPVNKPPVVSISSPTKNNSYITPATIIIDATASDPDGTVSKVEFFNGSVKIGEKLTPPYSIIWKDVTAGTYTLTATAKDNLNAKTVSAPVTVTVENAISAVNQFPVVNIANPSHNSAVEVPAIILISADASDTDGSVSKVEYYIGDQKIGENQTAPFEIPFEFTKAGIYEITAIATDNQGAVATSSITIYARLSIDDPEFINLYPNPNDGRFTISLLTSPLAEKNYISIVNMAGHTIFKDILSKDENIKHLDLSQIIKKGIYYLIIVSDQIAFTKKFIKE